LARQVRYLKQCFESVAQYLQEFFLDEEVSRSHLTEMKQTVVKHPDSFGCRIPFYLNEFWTAKQRQASSIHEISYRACFKAQLPRFFVDLLTEPGDLVYDPFSGRGTTVIEAALMGRRVIANDVNPLSSILSKPRLSIPEAALVKKRLEEIRFTKELQTELDLSMFYHPETLAEIISLKNYLARREADGAEDNLDRWLRMVATNRLSGHSSGFFSVYTLPPNQAVSASSQEKINQKRKQSPPYRDISRLIERKTLSLLRNLDSPTVETLNRAAQCALFLQNDAAQTPEIEDQSVNLTVTSPPFMDIVQYSKDNWLRCWFNGLDSRTIEERITMAKTVKDWSEAMGRVFAELYRITVPGGWVAFEVGEVRKGKIKLEEYVIPLGLKVGFICAGVLINSQSFTKTANIWGIDNNRRGTNTNRIVLFQKTMG
jgi:hypothetical protein